MLITKLIPNILSCLKVMNMKPSGNVKNDDFYFHVVINADGWFRVCEAKNYRGEFVLLPLNSAPRLFLEIIRSLVRKCFLLNELHSEEQKVLRENEWEGCGL